MTAWRPSILGSVSNGLEYRDGSGPDWRTDALCARVDPELFHPEKGGGVRQAKAICQRCPVIAECLEWALSDPQQSGVAGGLSERQRREIRAGRAVA